MAQNLMLPYQEYKCLNVMDQDIKARYFNNVTVRLEGKFIIRVAYRHCSAGL